VPEAIGEGQFASRPRLVGGGRLPGLRRRGQEAQAMHDGRVGGLPLPKHKRFPSILPSFSPHRRGHRVTHAKNSGEYGGGGASCRAKYDRLGVNLRADSLCHQITAGASVPSGNT
jgi:hypothetical protein